MKHKWKKTSNIFQINLLTASVCNLTCKFCYLHKNESYKIFNEEVINSWKTGEYFKNVKDVLSRLNSDPNNIRNLELWGGETLLFIKEITPKITDFIRYFKNIEKIRISTNWMINVDDFFEFIKVIDSEASKRIDINLQLSIDGLTEDFLKSGHNGNVDIYKSNIKKFTQKVNNYKLKNVFIYFNINSNVEKNLFFKYFSNYDNIKKYVSDFLDFINFINENCISSHIECLQDCNFPGYALPCTDTVEDGLEFAKICNLWNFVAKNEFPDLYKKNKIFLYGTGAFNDYGIFGANCECSELSGSRTILPDGTITMCSGTFIYGKDYHRKELIKEKDQKFLIQNDLISTINYNPLKLSDKELDDIEWYISTGFKGTKNTYRNFNTSIIRELAYAGQIDKKYVDNEDLILKMANFISTLNTCPRENIFTTNLFYVNDPSIFRRYMNGAVDTQIDVIKCKNN